MGKEVILAIVTGAISVITTFLSGILALRKKQLEQRYKEEIEAEKRRHEAELEKQRIGGSTTVDMSKVVVEAQQAVQDAFKTQLAEAQRQHELLRNDLQTARSNIKEIEKNSREKIERIERESEEQIAQIKKQRTQAEKLVKQLTKQVYRFQSILSSIKLNLSILGTKIRHVHDTVHPEHTDLLAKVEQLNDIHCSIVDSLESVDLGGEQEGNIWRDFQEDDPKERSQLSEDGKTDNL